MSSYVFEVKVAVEVAAAAVAVVVVDSYFEWALFFVYSIVAQTNRLTVERS